MSYLSDKIYENKPLGLVLCGGLSTRMGSDKGLLPYQDELTWAALGDRLLKPHCSDVYFSIRSEQLSLYQEKLGNRTFVCDQLPLGGPLNGILTTHGLYPEKDLFVWACDLIEMHADGIQQLHETFEDKSGEHDFVVFQHPDGNYEPLCGLYSAEGLAKIYALSIHQKLQKHSMKHVLELGNTYGIQLNDAQISFFNNHNTPTK
jgi:molybdopterin-guanine dinucleotide biosynthesis protein A